MYYNFKSRKNTEGPNPNLEVGRMLLLSKFVVCNSRKVKFFKARGLLSRYL